DAPRVSLANPELECQPKDTSFAEAGSLQTACVLQSGTVVLNVEVVDSGLPSYTIRTWFKQGSPPIKILAGGSKYSMDKVGNEERLTINDITVDDEGSYYLSIEHCIENLSTENSPSSVKVYAPPVIQPSGVIGIPPNSCQNDNTFVSINLRGTSSFDITSQPKVCLLCPSTGRDPPSYSWQRDGTLIDGESLSFLPLDNANDGVYSCIAQNVVGEDRAEVTLNA
ncbi:hypothetical protein, partial [Salmonella sp. s51228]|uniref:hypothetical protein n=1 Tax=Salmonella sp. s51228 TaxID=3159652 RepID=UPI00397EB73C